MFKLSQFCVNDLHKRNSHIQFVVQDSMRLKHFLGFSEHIDFAYVCPIHGRASGLQVFFKKIKRILMYKLKLRTFKVLLDYT